MAQTLSVAIQKGGSAKTTTSAILAYRLSQTGRVLCVDMDSQGNLTELLTGLNDLEVFRHATVLEAMQSGNAAPYVVAITDTLHLLPADDFLALLPRWIYQQESKSNGTNASLFLKKALDSVADHYDWIIIDTPPALSEATVNALGSSDYVLIPFEASRFCYSAVKNFLGTVENIQEMVNPRLEIAGLLRCMIDNRRKDAREFVDLVQDEWGDTIHIFDTVITRTAHVGRLSLLGFKDNPELNKVLQDYEDFFQELMKRV